MAPTATIFPNFGGRFSFSREDCLAIAEAARQPLGSLKPIFPAPAGGMSVGRVADMVALYGVDTVLLVGGDLHRHPDGIYAASRQFLEKVMAETPGRACHNALAGIYPDSDSCMTRSDAP